MAVQHVIGMTGSLKARNGGVNPALLGGAATVPRRIGRG
jgi:hypothetical protein